MAALALFFFAASIVAQADLRLGTAIRLVLLRAVTLQLVPAATAAGEGALNLHFFLIVASK